MVAQPISSLTEFTPQPRMLVPVVDPQASLGLKNGYLTIEALTNLADASEQTGGSFISNAQTIITGFTFPPNINALSVGPVVIAEGIDVVLPPSSNWKVI